MKQKKEFIPAGRHETVRRKIISVIEERPLSAKEISGIVGVPEKAVLEHIPHIQKTLSNERRRLTVTPSECIQCGFLFKKREKLKKPGKCPVCRSETITYPLFSIE